MKMFDALTNAITIIKSRITTVSPSNVFGYEPADGMPDIDIMPAIYAYFSDSDFTKADGSSQGEQNHEPKYYFDVYVQAKATKSQSTGIYTFAIDKAHQQMRLIVSELYDIIMSKDFRTELEKLISFTGGTYLQRFEKLGTSKLAENNRAFVGFRITAMWNLEEDPPGTSGVALNTIADELIAESKEQNDNN
jgi:hypothetical protein